MQFGTVDSGSLPVALCCLSKQSLSILLVLTFFTKHLKQVAGSSLNWLFRIYYTYLGKFYCCCFISPTLINQLKWQIHYIYSSFRTFRELMHFSMTSHCRLALNIPRKTLFLYIAKIFRRANIKSTKMKTSCLVLFALEVVITSGQFFTGPPHMPTMPMMDPTTTIHPQASGILHFISKVEFSWLIDFDWRLCCFFSLHIKILFYCQIFTTVICVKS